MKNRLKNIFGRIVEREDISFIFVSILFFALFYYLPPLGDDIPLRQASMNMSLSDCWNFILEDYYNWSSRVIVDIVLRLMVGSDKLIFVFLNAIITYAFLRCLSILFISKNKREGNIFISTIFLLMPIGHLGSAGWITTYTTYFWPVVFGFLALIPIKKVYSGESFRKWEYVLYAVSLVYAANEEMEMVVLLCCYTVFLVLFAKNRMHSKFIVVQTVLTYASLVFTITTPGNDSRSITEQSRWFQDYGMLNLIDKVELGFTSTMFEIVFNNYAFFIVICALLMVALWKKYSDALLRLVAAFPFAITVMYGPLYNVTVSCLYGTKELKKDISKLGLVNVENSYSFGTFMQFVVLCFVAICFIIALWLLFENSYQFFWAIALLVSGTASRVAMGFSPTVWGSGNRTFSIMLFCIVAIGVIVYDWIDNKSDIVIEKKRYIINVMTLLGALGYINCWYYVMG